MTDDELRRVVPNTRRLLVDELDDVAAGRARMTGRPVVVAGFLNADRLHVHELGVNEDDDLVVVRRRLIKNPREAIAAKIERVTRRVLEIAQRRDDPS